MTLSSLFFVLISIAHAFTVPLNDGFVTDEAGVLSIEQEQGIEALLQTYKEQTSNEIAILIIPSLNGGVDSDIATEVLRDWGVGDKEKNNGVLLLHAYEDRRVFITVGYGLEGALPDLVLDGIIAMDIVPAFQKGDYGIGFTQAINAIQKHIGNEYTADRYVASNIPYEGIMLCIIFALQGIAGWLASTRSWWLGGVIGFIGGIILTMLFSWWLSIPLLALLGLLFDYLISKTSLSRGFTYGNTSIPSRFRTPYSSGRRSSFGGFGGGRSGGAGAGRSY